MFHYKVGSSGSVTAAEDSLNQAIGLWIELCLSQYGSVLPDDNPAQAIYTSSWMPWLRYHHEHEALPWLRQFRDSIDDHFTRADLWFHGYWRTHALDRGAEHFLVFLGGLWELSPDDPVTIEMVVDAAEHLGNWSDDVPAWFDWDTALFRSVYLGTNGPSQADDYPLNIPLHLYGFDKALLAYRMTGQSQYLDLALAGATRWADAIVKGDRFPLALNGKAGISDFPRPLASRYGEFLQPGVATGGDLQRANAFLEAGGVQFLMKLWQYAREPRFIEAAERTLDLCVTDVANPNANALVAAIRFYRNHSGRVRYDDAVLQTTENLFPYFIESLNLDDHDRMAEGQPGAVAWRENTLSRQHNPLLLGLAAEISGNERLATRALDLGLAYLEIARMAFAQGRDRPADGRTVSAVVRGGRRDNGAGIVTELWVPLQKRFCADPFARRDRPSRRPFPLRLAR